MNLGEFYYEEDKVTREMTGMIAEESAAYSAVLWESRGVAPVWEIKHSPPLSLKQSFFVYFVLVCILSKSNNLLLQFDETGP